MSGLVKVAFDHGGGVQWILAEKVWGEAREIREEALVESTGQGGEGRGEECGMGKGNKLGRGSGANVSMCGSGRDSRERGGEIWESKVP
jgi:hypothetical protein